MITLYPKPEFSASKYGRPANHAKRSPLKNETLLTSQQIKAEARRLLAGGLPSRVWYALDLLSVGGVLSATRLGIQERMLRHWSSFGLFERLQIAPQETKGHYEKFGLLDGDPVLYILGPVGVEISTQRHEVLPPSGYQGYSTMRVMHDLMTNEVVLRLADRLGVLGMEVEWLGKYEITLSDRSRNIVLEPDALLRFRKDGWEHAFVLEYHNEDKQTRAMEKVKKYEIAHEDGDWGTRWEVETFPPVLAIFWHPIVGTGYQNALQGKRVKCAYYGKTLKAVLEGKIAEWVLTATMEKVKLIELS
jgi:hypothetical protein